MEQGGITAYAAAFIVFSLPHAIFVVSIFTALLPGMAGSGRTGSPTGSRGSSRAASATPSVIILPAPLGLIALAMPMSRLHLRTRQRALGDAEPDRSTSAGFAVGLPFFSMFQLLTRTFYSMQDTRTPALVNVAAAVVNIAADLLFVYVFGWGSRAWPWATRLSYVFGIAVLRLILRGRLGGISTAADRRARCGRRSRPPRSRRSRVGLARLVPTGSVAGPRGAPDVVAAVSVGHACVRTLAPLSSGSKRSKK